jgi:hypothetical protein
VQGDFRPIVEPSPFGSGRLVVTGDPAMLRS